MKMRIKSLTSVGEKKKLTLVSKGKIFLKFSEKKITLANLTKKKLHSR